MLVFITCAMPLILIFCGFSIDIGMLEWQKARMQSAADAAALGAQVAHDREDADWQTQGQQDAALNGFQDGTNGVSVQVYAGADYGEYTGMYDGIEVKITQPINTIFMRLARINSVSVVSRSTSALTPCVYLLGTNSLNTYSLRLDVTSSIGYFFGSTMGCPVYAANSIYADSNSSVWTNAMNITGPASSSSISGGVFHMPQFNAKVLSDPLAYLTQPPSPSNSACNYTAANFSAVTTTLNPGVYCGGITIFNSTITLNPGLYTFTGGAHITSSSVMGSNVTLFFTANSGSLNYGQFVATLSQLSLSAGTTSVNGSIPTVLFFFDRNWIQTSTYDAQFLSGTTSGDGVYYLPAVGMKFYANSFGNALRYHAVVANSLDLISTAYSPKSDFSSVPTGNPFRPKSGIVQ